MATVTQFNATGDGASPPVLRDTRDGYVLSEQFTVTNLSGPIAARPLEAITATGITRGAAHASVPGILADEISATLISPTIARVSVTYRPLNFEAVPPSGGGTNEAELEVGASVQIEETNLDAAGNVLVVSADVETVDENNEPYTETVAQEVRVSRQVPNATIRFRRRENDSPFYKATEYVGTVNGVAWAGAGPRQWLCTAIRGVSSDGGDTYDVTYEFHHRVGTWDASIIYKDPETDLPPDNLVDGVGRKTVQIYPIKAFDSLGVGI
jgi:hypothetical protein